MGMCRCECECECKRGCRCEVREKEREGKEKEKGEKRETHQLGLLHGAPLRNALQYFVVPNEARSTRPSYPGK